MYKKFRYIELNSSQFEIMNQRLPDDIYKWDNSYLEDRLLGKLHNQSHLYAAYKEGITEDEKKQNSIVDEINKIVDNYNRKITTTSKDIINDIKKKYTELYKFGKIENYNTYESEMEKAIIFNKIFLITGIGGIGKSQYMFDFGKTLKKERYKHLLIYGKYCNNLCNRVFNEIVFETKNSKFYFLIDAINEFDEKTKKKILQFIIDNRDNENLRVIITYRDNSFEKNEYLSMEKIATDVETFSGVSTYDAIEKISEKYNIDLSVYDHLLDDRNPYHLSLAVRVISNNILMSEEKKPLIKGTHLYENMIKQALDVNRWRQTKQVINEVLRLKEKRLPTINLISLLGSDSDDYIIEMKEKAFATTYLYDGQEYFVFLNESLVDYLIARTLFNEIKSLDETSIINVVNEIIDEFYSISEPLILMIFEKFTKNIRKALNIIKKSKLSDSLRLETFNELCLTKANQLYIKKRMKINMPISNTLIISGGNHYNPFNCTNYLNEIIFNKRNILSRLKYNKYEINGIRSKLKVWVRSIAKYDYSTSYLEEKFWFAFWISSLPNGNIRFLARKLMFEIAKLNNQFIDVLIQSYEKTSDDYIKEAIIQVLSTLKKKEKKIVNFFKKINTYELININCLQYIHLYLYGKEDYIKDKKYDVLLDQDAYFNQKIFKFFSIVDFRFKYDYRMFGLEVYNINKNNIRFHYKFLKEKKSKITKINKEVKENFECIKKECPAHGILKDLLKNVYKDIREEEWPSQDVYLAWQKQYKKFMKKYNVKLDDLEKSRIYESDEKDNVYKALDLAISNTIGSISSNYYMSEFCMYCDGNLGYTAYTNDYYKEKPVLYYPISVYNEDIDYLDKKLLQNLIIPTKKTETWSKNHKLSIQNFRNIIKPISHKNDDWRLIYGSIKKKENKEDGMELYWSDDYILNLAINEDYQLSYDADSDRLYTIETDTIYDDLDNVHCYNFSRTSSVRNTSEFSDIFIQTDFNVPPSEIIRRLKLSYNRVNSSWVNEKNEEVILVNNNRGYWYNDGITGSIYIKEKYFQKLLKNNKLKYFGFCERFFGDKGFRNESALQIELFLDNTEKYYRHYTSKRKPRSSIEKYCLKCPFYKEELKHQEKWKNAKIDWIIDDLPNDEEIEADEKVASNII